MQYRITSVSNIVSKGNIEFSNISFVVYIPKPGSSIISNNITYTIISISY